MLVNRESDMKYKSTGLLTAMVMLCLWSPASLAGGISDWFNDTLIDPEDGMLDASDYLASAKGFLPIPIIITEPAVGYGLGLAVAYFHSAKELDPDVHTHRGPPSISVGFGAKTENDTYLYGGGHLGVWKNDHVRYAGAIAKMNVNLTFYLDGRNDQFGLLDDGLGFNIDGSFLFQQAKFRLRESNWWIGAEYIYVNASNTFDLNSILPPEIPNPNFDFDLGGIGFMVQYDGRKTIFTPSSGLSATLNYRNYDKTWGSDFDYDIYSGNLLHYTPFGDYSSLGLRLEGQTSSGDLPFFAYPFIDLRGIPAMRYQGESTLVGEAEYLWGVTPRWTVVFFGGVGRTSAIDRFQADGKTVGAGGLGFRYRLARKFGLQTGVDIARGPEDTSIYLTVGSAWQY